MTGATILSILLLARGSRPSRTEAGLGALMALCSISGNTALAFALSTYQVPGNIAFPISNGGSLFMVVITGVLLFRERLGWYGIAGCVLGSIAIILLSI
jgi:drug/metabolite transporter (DMT)-like permease